jgi:hypothetical protein
MGVRILRRTDLDGAEPLVRLALLIGLPAKAPSEKEFWSEVGVALGLNRPHMQLTPESIHAGLMGRNEPVLAQLVGGATAEKEGILADLEARLGL